MQYENHGCDPALIKKHLKWIKTAQLFSYYKHFYILETELNLL